MSVRTLIVDDERLARSRVKRLLAAHREIEIIGECSGGRAAVQAIRKDKPELMLLDVQMPDLDGFGVLTELAGDALPAVIFVTAYDQYALRAFEACAADYLLKPYTPERFAQALDRALRWIGSASPNDNDERLRRLLREVLQDEQVRHAVAGEPGMLDRFVVKRQDRTHFVRADDVDWIESDGNYVRLHVGSASHVVRGTIGACVDRLDPRHFVRVHRRYVVNIDRVKEVQPWFGGDYVIILQNGQQVRLSRTYREHFQNRVGGA